MVFECTINSQNDSIFEIKDHFLFFEHSNDPKLTSILPKNYSFWWNRPNVGQFQKLAISVQKLGISKIGHFGSKLPIYHWGATVCVNFWIKITQKFQSWHDLEILEAAQLSIWNWLSRIGNVKTKDAVIEIISRLLYRILNRHNLQKRSNQVIKGTGLLGTN